MDELKDKGNLAFKESRFREAMIFYTDAINLTFDSSNKFTDELSTIENTESLLKLKEAIKTNDCLHKCLNNRAQCYLKLGKYKKAVDDTSKGAIFYHFIL
jgi:tetratricopeptide (TPR) repeat protein